MECPSCGATLRDGAVFCSSCGERVSAQTGPGRPAPARDDDWQTPPAGGSRFGAGNRGGVGAGFNPTGMGRAPRRPSPGGLDFNQAVARLQRLARLDTSVFRDARDDPTALVESLAVAAVAILLMALGGWLWVQFKFGGAFGIDTGRFFIRSVIFGTILGFGMWVAWVAVAALILTRVYRHPVDLTAQLRALGLAAAPMAAGLLMLIDPLHIAFGVGSVAAAAALTQVALQETTDATAGEIFVANIAGFALFAVVLGFLGQGNSQLAPGIFALLG